MKWFNIGASAIKVAGQRVVAWNAFNRNQEHGGHAWGFGVLQVNQRHAIYLGSMGLCVGFVWLVGSHNSNTWGSPLTS